MKMKIKKLLPWKRFQKSKKNRSDDGGTKQVGNDDEDSTSNRSTKGHSQFMTLREHATQRAIFEPFISPLMKRTILHPETKNFKTAISRVIALRLISSCGKDPLMSNNEAQKIIEDAMDSPELEYGHTMIDAIIQDMEECQKRDPACETILEVILFYKGFAALVCHRAARRHYGNVSKSVDRDQRFVSLWLQSQASAAFGVDIHPAAEIGAGVFFDHATGLVVGETARIGNNCTILHGVTLGGTGKDAGDRHPKVGDDVLIGAGTSILGNIKIGNGAKIGAGSIVLKPIPHGATAVGSPAKIIGWAKESKPGSILDTGLSDVVIPGGGGDSIDGDNNSSVTLQAAAKIAAKEDAATAGTTSSSTISSLEAVSENPAEDGEKNGESKDLEGSDTIEQKTELRRSSCPLPTGSLPLKNMCMFRMISCNLNRELVSYANLNEVLGENCTEDEIGEVYMELLKKDPKKEGITQRGLSTHFLDIAQTYTKMSPEQCQDAKSSLSGKCSITY